MRFHLTVLKRLFLAGLLGGCSLNSSRGQAVDSPIVFQSPEAITVKLVDPPSVGRSDNAGGGRDNAQWLQVEFHYAVKPKPPIPFLDSVEFRIWVEGRDLYDPTATTAQGLAVALTGKVTYINLAPARDAYGSFYIAPGTLTRYCTKNGVSDFTEKFNIHIEAYVGGTKVDYFDKHKEQDPNWFAPLHPVADVVYRQNQCAFIVTDAARYPTIKLDTPAQ